jgi:hypothetical protein
MTRKKNREMKKNLSTIRNMPKTNFEISVKWYVCRIVEINKMTMRMMTMV